MSEGDMVVVAYSMLIVAISRLELGYLEESCVHKNVGGEGSWCGALVDEGRCCLVRNGILFPPSWFVVLFVTFPCSGMQ
jgi:hypothetical protein